MKGYGVFFEGKEAEKAKTCRISSKGPTKEKRRKDTHARPSVIDQCEVKGERELASV